MRRLATTAGLLLALLVPTNTASTEAHRRVLVYVCDSRSSVAYHQRERCSGLQRCTHTIIRISDSEARDRGKRPCKLCW